MGNRLMVIMMGALLMSCGASESTDSEPLTGSDARREPAPRGSQSVPPSPLPPPTSFRPKAPPTSPTVEPPEPGPLDFGLGVLIDQAIADLTDRLAGSRDEISVVSQERVVWPDAGHGCPEPGRSYAQVASSGWVIVLGADGDLYRYHAVVGGSPPFLCDHSG